MEAAKLTLTLCVILFTCTHAKIGFLMEANAQHSGAYSPSSPTGTPASNRRSRSSTRRRAASRDLRRSRSRSRRQSNGRLSRCSPNLPDRPRSRANRRSRSSAERRLATPEVIPPQSSTERRSRSPILCSRSRTSRRRGSPAGHQSRSHATRGSRSRASQAARDRASHRSHSRVSHRSRSRASHRSRSRLGDSTSKRVSRRSGSRASPQPRSHASPQPRSHASHQPRSHASHQPRSRTSHHSPSPVKVQPSGYFWHITDFHFDPQYTPQGDTRRQCRRADERGSSGHHRALGRLGDYSCDSPLALIESAARYMRTRHSENVEFVLWTGDIVSAQYSEDEKYQAITNITEVLRGAFSSHFVFPVLGHTDPAPSERLTNLWMKWLPLEALQTFRTGGYYTIEQTQSKLRIVVLNTNLFGARESSSSSAKNQWEWLDEVLDKATTNREMVYIVGHAAPGSDSRLAYDAYSADANAQFLRMVRKHARIIAGQFYGHLHADTFRVFYDNDRPVSWALLAPSVSPHRTPSGTSNPGLRLYKFDINTGKVLDYTQYYLDLATANRAGSTGSLISVGGPEWAPEYNLTQYYSLHDVSAYSLHNLADKLRFGMPHETITFHKYLRAYNVKHETAESCDGACAHQHFCAITCLEHVAYRQCVEAAASALAAAGDANPLLAPPITLLFTLFTLILITVDVT